MRPLLLALPMLLAAHAAFAQSVGPGSGGGPLQLAPPPPSGQASPQAPVPSPSGPATTVEPSSAGYTPAPWVESQQAQGSAPACLIGKSGGGYAFQLTVSAASPGNVVFSIQRSDWTLAASDGVPVTMAFDDGTSMTESGSLSPNGLSVSFNATTLRPWMHEFTKAGSVLVTPTNSAFAPIRISLATSTAAINQMGDCIKAGGMQGVPPPFVSAPAGAVASTSAPQTAPPPIAVAAPPAVPKQSAEDHSEDVDVLALNCHFTVAGPEVEGEVKNVSSRPINYVRTYLSFRDAHGAFVSKADGGVDFNPLLAGQTSAFSVYGDLNPVITQVDLSVGVMLGSALQAKGSMHALCAATGQ